MNRFATLFGPMGRNKKNSKDFSRRSGASTCRLRLESLEERALLAVTTGAESTFFPAPTGVELVVTTLADIVDDTDGVLSLREAIASSADGDTITFDATLAGGTITLSGEQLTIDKSITIDASRLKGGITIDGNRENRVFYVTGGSEESPAALVHLTIQKGYVTFDPDAYGGGIYNTGILTLTNCTVAGNASYSEGGGIYNRGSLTMTACSVEENSALDGGGISNSGELTLTNCFVIKNSAYGGDYGGGGIDNWGELTLMNCAVSENSTDYDGGGIYNEGVLTLTDSEIIGNSSWSGGGIKSWNGELTLTNCTVSGNSASEEGGGIYTYNVLSLYNSIVALNTDSDSGTDLCYDGEGAINGYYSLSSFEDWTESVETILYDPSKPLFVDAENGNYSLAEESQAIDVGNNEYIEGVETDLAGNPRIVNEIVDLGAYEFQGGTEPLATPTISEIASAGANRHSVTWDAVENAVGYELTYSTDQEVWSRTLSTTETSFVMTGLTYGDQVYYKVKAVGDGASWSDSDWSEEKSLYVCPMDVNGDKIVSSADLTLLSKAWFARPTSANWDARADIDGSGMVNSSDLTFLSSNWLKRPTSAGLTYPAEKAQIFADTDFDALEVDCDFDLDVDFDEGFSF